MTVAVWRVGHICATGLSVLVPFITVHLHGIKRLQRTLLWHHVCSTVMVCSISSQPRRGGTTQGDPACSTHLWDEDENYHADWTQDTMDANARLIAAAPMMYGQLGTSIDALREALRQAASADYDQVHALLSGVIAGHELAIAQAEGRP